MMRWLPTYVRFWGGRLEGDEVFHGQAGGALGETEDETAGGGMCDLDTVQVSQ